MLKAIADATTAVIYIKDVDGRYLLINRRFEELFHVSKETVVGKTDHDIFAKATADRFRANDLDVQRSGAVTEFEETVAHDDGEHIYISIKFPLVRDTGDVYAVCGISTDISPRKRAEAELETTKRSLERLVDERTADLREANRRLAAEVAEREAAADRLQRLIDTANEGIFTIDLRDRISFVNARMADMLGYEPADMLGSPIYDFIREDLQDDAAQRLEQLKQGISSNHDAVFRRKGGSALWSLLSTNPLRDRSGAIVGALAMVTDITERKKAERQQTLLLRELDHRVKNTLATAVALSDLTSKNAVSIRGFHTAFASRLQAMARTHEALARAQWQEVSFDEVARIVLGPLMASNDTRVTLRGDALRVPTSATTPLALALNELATNALKHGALSTPHGGLSITWDREENGSFALRWIEEDGPRCETPSSQGTGIRLLHGLIEHELGGSVRIDFNPKGLTCRLVIPHAPGNRPAT